MAPSSRTPLEVEIVISKILYSRRYLSTFLNALKNLGLKRCCQIGPCSNRDFKTCYSRRYLLMFTVGKNISWFSRVQRREQFSKPFFKIQCFRRYLLNVINLRFEKGCSQLRPKIWNLNYALENVNRLQLERYVLKRRVLLMDVC